MLWQRNGPTWTWKTNSRWRRVEDRNTVKRTNQVESQHLEYIDITESILNAIIIHYFRLSHAASHSSHDGTLNSAPASIPSSPRHDSMLKRQHGKKWFNECFGGDNTGRSFHSFQWGCGVLWWSITGRTHTKPSLDAGFFIFPWQRLSIDIKTWVLRF